MASMFTVTFDTVSPESAEEGDVCAAGVALAGGWKVDTWNNPNEDTGPIEMSLREALSITGESLTWVGSWFDADQTEEDYATGEVTRYSLHPPRTITAASLARLFRVLRVQA